MIGLVSLWGEWMSVVWVNNAWWLFELRVKWMGGSVERKMGNSDLSSLVDAMVDTEYR